MVKMYASIDANSLFKFRDCCNRYLHCIIFEREGGDTEAIPGQLLTAEAAVYTAQEVNLSFKICQKNQVHT